MAVSVETEHNFQLGKSTPLFKTLGPNVPYDVTPDGEFLMIEPGESDTPPTQVNVVLNWLQEVKQRVAGTY